MENLLMSNKAELVGEIASEITFSHESFEENFYSFFVKVPRLSESVDYINVTVSEVLLNNELGIGDNIHLTGQFRSYNNYTGVGSKLILTFFAKTVCKVSRDCEPKNEVVLNGYVCKTPTFRTTPFGREITDILLAVNRSHNKSDYIPCIAWGRNARLSCNFNVGDNIAIVGRMQSRQYQKRLDEDNVVTKTAYEVSVNKIEKL